MHVQKIFLPVMLGILLIIAVLPPVSAGNQFADVNTASGIGVLTAGTGTFPAFSPANFPAPFVPGSSSSDLRAVFRSPLTIESLGSVDYDFSLSSPQGRRSISGTPCAQSYYLIKRR